MAEQVKVEAQGSPSKPGPPKPQGRGGFFNRGGRGSGGRGGRGRGASLMGGGQDDNMMGGGGGYGGPMNRGKMRSPEERVLEKLSSAFSGPTYDIPAKETAEAKKFTGHCRLYVGNIPNDLKEEEFVALFTPYGETNEPFINREKAFAFIKMDYRSSAERAKHALDQSVLRGKNLKVRYAQHGATLKLSNLSPWVSNELLEKAFSVFGEVERCIVNVDARGKPTGEGVVEFAQKPAAMTCLKMLSDGCFFLTSCPKPVIAEAMTEQDDDDGMMEKNLMKRHQEFMQEREMPPRFAIKDSFEFEYGQRWKDLNDLEKQKIEAVKAEIRYMRQKLEGQMEYAKQDAEINQLREQLRQREMEKEERMRKAALRMSTLEEERKRNEEIFRAREEQMAQVMSIREEGMRSRAQANSAFLQQQEAAYSGIDQPAEGNGGGDFAVGSSRGDAGGKFGGPSGYDQWEQGGPGMSAMEQGSYGGTFGPGESQGMGGGRQWGGGRGDRGGADDFQSKRRRF